jgi:RNA polymerase sigma factor (TIGR02999 family)
MKNGDEGGGDGKGSSGKPMEMEKADGRDSLNEVMTKAYDEIHKIAKRYMSKERRGHTLRPTELISEVYVRLVKSKGLDLGDRAQFCTIVARTIREILIDYARMRGAEKRGSGVRPVTLDDVIASADRPEDLIAFDEALSKLAERDERKARMVELFYFGGFTQDEIAAMYAVHVNTVGRDLRFAEAVLGRHLSDAT